MNLWKNCSSFHSKMPTIEYYKTDWKITDGAVIVFPGGGYTHLAEHEGKTYAHMINLMGADAFVVKYSLAPDFYPAQIADARRAVQFVRYHADEYQINPDKIAVMGSSAGGHLAALLSVYKEKITPENPDDIDALDFSPNYQILAYPVIDFANKENMHEGSTRSFMGKFYGDEDFAKRLSPNLIADETAPPAFIWHNFDDAGVPVTGTLDYVKRLKKFNIPVELHLYPYGGHGIGTKPDMHSSSWTLLLNRWFKEIGFFEK